MQDSTHLALYRKWRSRTFDEVYGQDHVTRVLKYEASIGQPSHAYLFCGSRGTGKTSCAKILAKAVNCLSPRDGNPCGECAACRGIDAGTATDVLEIDAASNNGVDNIRDIRDEVNFAPSDLKYRVYIIDEVHMLSASAFNALLKTLEEPPAHVIFILATTELQKLPATIISRCQRFDFRRIRMEDLIARMQHVAEAEGIQCDPEAMQLLARLAQGGMRDALSLLELCSGGGTRVTVDRVNEAVGSVGRGRVLATVRAVAGQDYDTIFGIIAEATAGSKDLTVFWQELMSLYRDMLVVKTTAAAARYLDLTDAETAQLSEVSELFTREQLVAHCRLLDGALASMQRAGAVKRTVAELTLIKMSDRGLDTSTEALLARIVRLEDMLASVMAGGALPASAVEMAPAAAHDAIGTAEGTAVSKDAPAAPAQPGVESAELPKADSARASAEPDKPSVSVEASNSDGRRVLRAIRCWPEVIQRVSHPPLTALMRNCRAYRLDNGSVVLRAGDVFTLSGLKQSSNLDAIRQALNHVLQCSLRENELTVEEEPQGRSGPDETIFDELDGLIGENNGQADSL